MDNFQNYSNNNGTAVFTNLIEENQKELVKAYELQNTENFEESINCIERVARNFHFLGMMADQFAYTPELIQENRELLSQAHVNTIYDKFPKYVFAISSFVNFVISFLIIITPLKFL